MNNSPQPPDVLEFRVYGTPASKGSIQPFAHGGFRPDDRELEYWQDNVREAAQRALAGRPAMVGALLFEATFYVHRPMTHHDHEYSAETPDLDKLERAVYDGITKSRAWRDDKQASKNITEKRYVTASESKGVKVRISVIEPR